MGASQRRIGGEQKAACLTTPNCEGRDCDVSDDVIDRILRDVFASQFSSKIARERLRRSERRTFYSLKRAKITRVNLTIDFVIKKDKNKYNHKTI